MYHKKLHEHQNKKYFIRPRYLIKEEEILEDKVFGGKITVIKKICESSKVIFKRTAKFNTM